jgi:uncharacterized protein YegP (UPF0339 family)
MSQTPGTPGKDAARPRYLRVGVRLTARTATVHSVILVEGVPARLLAPGHPIVALVETAGQVTHVSRFQDPRIVRSTRRGGKGDHHVARLDDGVVEVSVPFGSLTDLTRVRISVVDLTSTPSSAVDLDELVRLVRELHGRGSGHVLRLTDIQATRAWAGIAGTLGVEAEVATFEIFLDHAGLYRWRLRDSSGEIVAVSVQGFRSLQRCEAELEWVRRNAAQARVVSGVRPPA